MMNGSRFARDDDDDDRLCEGCELAAADAELDRIRKDMDMDLAYELASTSGLDRIAAVTSTSTSHR